MPFPWLRWFGSTDSGRGGRRRMTRAQRRGQRDDEIPQEDSKAVAERRHQKIGFGVGAAFLFVIVGVVAFGYYQEFYKPPRVWAGSVNNVEFNMGDLVSRIRVLQGETRREGGQVNLATVPFEYLTGLLNAEILRQQTHSLGISITDDDIELTIQRRFTPRAASGQQTDPGQLELEYKNNYVSFLTDSNLSDGEYRVIIEEELAKGALAALLSRSIEDPQQQVEIQWIVIPLNGDVLAVDVVNRLENEDFTRIAQDLGAPSPFAGRDGYVGWVPKGAFPELDDTIFGNEEAGIPALEPDTFSDPIFTSDGSFIVKKLSGGRERQLEDIMFLKLVSESMDKWQQDALSLGSDQKTVKMKFNSRYYAWVADQVNITAPRLDRPTPVPFPGMAR